MQRLCMYVRSGGGRGRVINKAQSEREGTRSNSPKACTPTRPSTQAPAEPATPLHSTPRSSGSTALPRRQHSRTSRTKAERTRREESKGCSSRRASAERGRGDQRRTRGVRKRSKGSVEYGRIPVAAPLRASRTGANRASSSTKLARRHRRDARTSRSHLPSCARSVLARGTTSEELESIRR